MKHIELSTGHYIVVEVPAQSSRHCLERGKLAYQMHPADAGGLAQFDDQLLPVGSWQLIGTTEQIAENAELAERIAEKQGHNYSKLHHGVWEDRWTVDTYRNYVTKRWRKPFTGFHRDFFGPVESFQSLCQHHRRAAPQIPASSVWLRKEVER